MLSLLATLQKPRLKLEHHSLCAHVAATPYHLTRPIPLHTAHTGHAMLSSLRTSSALSDRGEGVRGVAARLCRPYQLAVDDEPDGTRAAPSHSTLPHTLSRVS
jgi:hypothetical protein